MDRTDDITAHAPDLRRFAFALCGRETIGPAKAHEELVRRALQITIQEASASASPQDLKLDLYRNFYRLRQRAPVRTGVAAQGLASALNDLPLAHRAALLLVSLEQFNYQDAGAIMGVARRALVDLLASGRRMLEGFTFSADLQPRRSS